MKLEEPLPSPSFAPLDREGIITGHDLVRLGVRPGRGFASELSHARQSLAGGEEWPSIAARIQERSRSAASRPPKLGLQPALPVSVAATPQDEEEEENVRLALEKMRELTTVPVVTAAALMPDTCPSGNEWGAIPVGGVVVTRNSVIPGAHSADVNCGMYATFFSSRASARELMDALRRSTFFGPFPVPPGQESHHPVLDEDIWSNPFLRGLENDALRYLGTQGDGNHFSYVGEIEVAPSLVTALDSAGHPDLAASLAPHRGSRLWSLVTHHGSRNFGAKVYRRGLEAAARYTAEVANGIPKNASWLDLDTEEGRQYWEALGYVGRWTSANHETVHRKFLHAAGAPAIAVVANHHNAVWRRDIGICHGKGATPAWRDGGVARLGVIPLNMGREILLVEGSDNSEFLSFAPHGAGRNRSRGATKKQFLDPATGEPDPALVERSLLEQTSGLEIAWASGTPDISETPLGYKPASKVRSEIEEFRLARVIAEVKPRGCMMAGEFRPRPGKSRLARLSLPRGYHPNPHSPAPARQLA